MVVLFFCMRGNVRNGGICLWGIRRTRPSQLFLLLHDLDFAPEHGSILNGNAPRLHIADSSPRAPDLDALFSLECASHFSPDYNFSRVNFGVHPSIRTYRNYSIGDMNFSL